MYKNEAVFVLEGLVVTESLAKHLSSQFLDYTLINVDDLLASAEGVEKDKELIIDATNKGILVDPKINTSQPSRRRYFPPLARSSSWKVTLDARRN